MSEERKGSGYGKWNIPWSWSFVTQIFRYRWPNHGVVIKFPICFTSHMHIVRQIMNIIHDFMYLYRTVLFTDIEIFRICVYQLHFVNPWSFYFTTNLDVFFFFLILIKFSSYSILTDFMAFTVSKMGSNIPKWGLMLKILNLFQVRFLFNFVRFLMKFPA
jgi:hypothetical protein